MGKPHLRTADGPSLVSQCRFMLFFCEKDYTTNRRICQ